MNMSTELLVIEKLELVPFFTKGDQLDDVLARIKAEAMAHVPDVSTLKGRNAIKKNVTSVVKSKTFLESQGKDLAAEYKLIPKAIDANRKKTRDFLTALQEAIREPLTAWEDEQKVIEAEELAKAEAIKVQAQRDDDHELATLQFENAMREREVEKQRLEQERIDREEQIKQQAAADAKRIAEAAAAEQIAQADRDRLAAGQREIAAQQAVIDAENKAAQEAIDAKAREDEAKRVAANAEWLNYISEAYEFNDRRNAKAREDKAAQDALNATIIAKRNADRAAEQAAENARLAEQQRQENERLRQEEEQRQREENKRFVGGINTKVMNDLVTHCGLSQDDAKRVVIAMAKSKIRNAQIIYK
jgi:hypothetical protein